jgi:hypothetical protein
MIRQQNISRLANRLYVEACERVGKKLALRIPETTIERDYCLAWLLCSMASHPVLSEALAFKGGTALRQVHFGEYRFSEDLDAISADMSQDHIDRIEYVSAYHADFVDDEQVHFPKDVQFLASQTQALTQQSGTVGRDIRIYDVITRNEAGQGQAEHRVNGDATGIDRGNASGSHDHDVLLRPLHKSLQQCRLAGAGFSRDETVFARVQGKLFGELEFSIVHHGKSIFGLEFRKYT